MMVSTRGRYALRFLLDLAEHGGVYYVPVKDVARREHISPKYLEQIIPLLVKQGLLTVCCGRKGGYKLARKPEEYTVGEILRLTEGELVPVSCLGCESDTCRRAGNCKTLPMWRQFNDLTNQFFDGVTLADLLHGMADNGCGPGPVNEMN